MKKFNKLFIAGSTKVQMPGEYGYRLVKEVHATRKWIKVEGYEGSFQRDDINCYSNAKYIAMYPSVDDLYTTDACGSVYERTEDANVFCGKLMGRTLSEFVKVNEDI